MQNFPIAVRMICAAALLAFLNACETDGLTPAPVVEAPLLSLNLDGDNLDAPFLNTGTYEAGVKLVPAQTAEAAGGVLKSVQFYLTDLPNTCAVRLYSGTDVLGRPDSLLYNAVVTSDIRTNRWNEHTLDRDIPMPDGQDLWVVIRYSHSAAQRSLGCDPGPAVTNGDWLYSGLDDQWETLRGRSGNEVNINWNIRAIAQP